MQQIAITLRKHAAELVWEGTDDIPAGQLTIRTEDPLEEGTVAREANHAHTSALWHAYSKGTAGMLPFRPIECCCPPIIVP